MEQLEKRIAELERIVVAQNRILEQLASVGNGQQIILDGLANLAGVNVEQQPAQPVPVSLN